MQTKVDAEIYRTQTAEQSAARLPVRTTTWAPGASHAKWKRAALLSLHIAVTALMSMVAVVLAYLLQYGWPPSLGQVRDHPWDIAPVLTGIVRTAAAPEFRSYLPVLFLAPFAFVLIFRWMRLYTPATGSVKPFHRAPRIVAGTLMGTAILAVAVQAAAGSNAPFSALQDTLFLAYTGTLMAFGMLHAHSGLLIGLVALRAMGIGLTRVAMVAGNDESAAALREELESPASEYRFHGIVRPERFTGARDASGTKELGTLQNIEAIINRWYLDELIIAVDPSDLSPSERARIAQTCWMLGVDLKLVTPFHPYFHTTCHPEPLGTTPLLSVRRVGLYATRSQAVKRAVDILASASALLALSPLMLLTALCIKLESVGPVLFIQERPGLHGRVFRILKFRSMRTDADSEEHREAQRRLIREGAPAGFDKNGQPIYGKVGDDPRITRVGRFIRRTSIDELPQLINVLWGEMSLVGPRPSVLYELEDYDDWHRQRLAIRPGITGLWQVSGRSRLTFEEMVRLDLQYIEEWSLWLDLKILLRTVPVVLKIDQAY